MLHADLMVRADDRPFQEAPDAFNAVRMNVAMHPLLRAMVDRLVLGVRVGDTFVARMLIGVDVLRLRGRRLVDEVMELLLVHPSQRLDPNRAFAFQRTDDCHLVPAIAPAHMAALSANVGFIHFHSAGERLGVDFSHGGPDTVAEEPGRPVTAEGERTLHLAGRNALLALRHQVDRQKPLPEGQMTVVEDSAAGNRKLVLALIAPMLVAILDRGYVVALTARALDALRPAKLFQVAPGAIFIRKLLNQLDEIHVRRFFGWTGRDFHICQN